MRGLRVALDGTFLDATPLVWSTTLNDQSFADVAYDPTDGHLAVWRDGRDDDNNNAIYAARITPSGSLDGSGVRVSGPGTHQNNALAVAHGRGTGAPFVVVWHHDSQPSLRAARIDGTGNVIDPGGFVLYTDPNLEVADDYRLFSNNLACTAVSCLFAWFDEWFFSVKAIRFRLDGTIIDSTPITIASSSIVHVTASGNGFLVLLGNRGYLVPETGPGSPTLVNLPGPGGVSDSLWDGSQFVLAWRAGTEIKITRLDATAHEIGPRVTVPGTSNEPYALRVIQDGADAIVVWWTESAVRAARYTSTGTLRDPTGVSISSTSSLQLRVGDAAAGAFPIIEQHNAYHPPGVGLWETVRWVAITGMGTPAIDAGVSDASIVIADASMPDSAVTAPIDAAIADSGVMPIDAPTADALSSPIDAATTGPDASDAGFGEVGSGGGCCQGGSKTNSVLAIAILCIVLRRRRRYLSQERQ
jgi:hypothetical protein